MNKKVLLLPIIGSFLLTGCKINLFGKTIYLFEKPKGPDTVIIDDDTPEDIHQHATSLSYASGSPSAPFYLKVGETRNLGVSLSPAPELDNEKTVNWTIQGAEYVSYQVNDTDTKKVTVEGVKTGTAVLTATNDYNRSLTYSFTIKVIDVDEENDYMWQYQTSDRAQFGYENVDGKRAGVTEGDAKLNGVTWHFTRSKATSLQSSMGAVGFGKNEEPETHIHLETENIRTIEKFSIEAASANSLAKMTVKVGNTVYLDNVTVDKDYYDVIGTIYSPDTVTPTAGKIEIDVVTPEHDPKQAGSAGYKTPGAFYLKSILINFSSDVPVATEKTYDFKEMYDDTESDFYKALGTKGKEVKFTTEDFDITFASLKKPGNDDKVQGYANTNNEIIIKPVKSGEVFYKVEAKFNMGTLTSGNNYSIEKSITGGIVYSPTGNSLDKESLVVKAQFFEDYLNCIRIKPSNSTYMGIESIKIVTVSGHPLTVKDITAPEEFTPAKTQYMVGETFSTEGLLDLSINFVEEDIRPEVLPVTALTWYDAPSYDSDPTKASTEFQLGTTSVYGVFKGEILVTVTGLTVIDDPRTITLVKSVDDIDETSHYYLVARQQKRFLRGSAGGSVGGGAAGVGTLEDAGEEITLSGAYRNDYYQFEIGVGKYAVKSTTGHYIGMTTGGGLSRNTDPNIKEFTLTMDPETYVLTMKFEYQPAEGEPIVRYIAFGTTAMSSLSTTEKANFSLYKVTA